VRRLLVLRHADAESGAGKPDHERRLTPEGEASAHAIGEALARIGDVPAIAYCSAADRARATLQIAAEAGAWRTEMVFDDALYVTSVTSTLDVVAHTPDVERVMIVGHNPTWAELVVELTGEAMGLRPATVVAIDLDVGTWADVPSARGDIAYVVRADDTGGAANAGDTGSTAS
jgi:phosphohistidine phosphatase